MNSNKIFTVDNKIIYFRWNTCIFDCTNLKYWKKINISLKENQNINFTKKKQNKIIGMLKWGQCRCVYYKYTMGFSVNMLVPS